MNGKKLLIKLFIIFLSFVLITIVSIQIYANFFLKNRIVSVINSKIDGKAKINFTTTDLYRIIKISGLNIFNNKKIGFSANKCRIMISPCIMGKCFGDTFYTLKASDIYINYKRLLRIISPITKLDNSKKNYKLVNYLRNIILKNMIVNFGTFGNIPIILKNIDFYYSYVENKVNLSCSCDDFSLFNGTLFLNVKGDNSSVDGNFILNDINNLREFKFSNGLSLKIMGNFSVKSNFQLSPEQLLIDRCNCFDLDATLKMGKSLFILKKNSKILGKLSILDGEININSDRLLNFKIKNNMGIVEGKVDFNLLKNITSEISIFSSIIPSGKIKLSYNKINKKLKIIDGLFKNKREKIEINGNISFFEKKYSIRLKSKNNKLSNLTSFLSKYYGLNLKIKKLISSDLKISGNLTNRVIPSGTLNFEDIDFENNRIKKAKLKFNIKKNILKVESSSLIFQDGNKATLDGKFYLDKSSSDIINIKNFKINSKIFQKYSIPLGGMGIISGRLKFKKNRWNFTGNIDSSSLTLSGRDLFKKLHITLDGYFDKKRVKVKNIELKNKNNIVDIAMKNGRTSISGRIEEKNFLNIIDFRKYFIKNFNYSKIDFSTSYKNNFKKIGGVFTISSLKFNFLSIPFKISKLKIKYYDSLLKIENFKINSGKSSLISSISFNFINKELKLSLNGNNLNVTPFLNKNKYKIRSYNSLADINLKLDYSFINKNITLNGGGTLKIKKVIIPMVKDSVENIATNIEFDNKNIIFKNSNFSISNIPWNLSGNIDFSKKISGNLNIKISSINGIWKIPNLVDTKGDATFFLKGSLIEPKIVGRINVKEGVLYLPMEFESNYKVKSTPIDMDINLIIKNRFWVRNPYINAELCGNINFYTKDNFSGLKGKLDVIRGMFSFNGKEFKIEEGNINFPSSIKLLPSIHLRTEAKIGEYDVNVDTDGSIDKIVVNLSSSPVLRRDEIFSLIATGNPRSSFSGNNSGKIGGEILLNFQKNQILGGIKNSIQNSFKLDDLSYNTDVSPETNKRKSSLRVGKYLSDKLFVTYTLEKGDELNKNEKYEFDYKMNKKTNFTIKNETNRGTIFGIKVKNRF